MGTKVGIVDLEEQNIIKELDLLREVYYPDNFERNITRVVHAMKYGRIVGSDFVFNEQCGCFYGHFIGLEAGIEEIADINSDIRGDIADRDLCTPIENLVLVVYEEDTLEDNLYLQSLYGIIQKYMAQHYPHWEKM